MIGTFRLSETAKAVLWLWHNDSDNWSRGLHAVCHRPTGVGVWTANQAYGLHLNYDVPDYDRRNAHILGGRELRLGWRDRRVLWRIIGRGMSDLGHKRIQRVISDWGADNIANRIGERTAA